MSHATVNRREFLKTGAAAGATLVIGLYLPAFDPRTSHAPAAPEPFKPNAWIEIRPDGAVTIWTGRSEMGQGVRTAMPMIVAEELEADWTRVRVAQADADPAYGDQFTVGSRSVRSGFEPLRKAGAAAREMLIGAAALSWNVPREACRARNGMVEHVPTGRRLGYGGRAPRRSDSRRGRRGRESQGRRAHGRGGVPGALSRSRMHGADELYGPSARWSVRDLGADAEPAGRATSGGAGDWPSCRVGNRARHLSGWRLRAAWRTDRLRDRGGGVGAEDRRARPSRVDAGRRHPERRVSPRHVQCAARGTRRARRAGGVEPPAGGARGRVVLAHAGRGRAGLSSAPFPPGARYRGCRRPHRAVARRGTVAVRLGGEELR